MRELLDQAALHLQEKQFQQALDLYLQVLQQDASNMSALVNISSILLGSQQYDKAMAHLNMALRLYPENAHFISERGVVNFMKGQIKEALLDLDHARQLEPQNPYRYSSRAFVRDRAGDLHGAIADYQQAISLDPEDAVAYNNLGLLLEKSGHQKAAKENFDRADQLQGRTKTAEAPRPLPKIRKDGGKIPAPEPAAKPSLSFKFYGQVLRSVFSTREGFQDFIKFLRRKS